jgi:chromosome segregation ATPase
MASTQSTTASMKTVAALVTMGGAPKPNAYGEFAKETIQKLKSSNEYEKNELQKLNAQFREYLDDVKRLEEANRQLVDDVDQAKQIYVPKEMDKTGLDQALDDLRRKLEDISLKCVQHQVDVEENENLIQNYGDKIKFYKNENEVQKQKINQLTALLDDLLHQRDYIKRASDLADDDIRRERDKMEKADKDLASLLKTLKESRTRNKKFEFEIQTLLDELAFRKAVFGEEIAELTKQHQVLSPVDLTNFYKNELLNAVRQIRNDFHNMNEQQLKDYKDQKERELNAVVREAEYERMQADLARERLNASQDLDLKSSKELKAGLNSDKDEGKRLQQEQAELVRRLGELESK